MDEPVVGRITQFLECVGGYFTYYLEDDVLAVLRHGHPLAVELENAWRAEFDTTNLLLFLHAVNQYGKGVERAKLLWPDLLVSLQQFTIRRATGEGKRDGEAPTNGTAPTDAMSGEVRALAVLTDHPDWSDAKIANAARVNRTLCTPISDSCRHAI